MFCLIRELIRHDPRACQEGCRLKTSTRLTYFFRRSRKISGMQFSGRFGSGYWIRLRHEH
jgi:hypothetical protein